MKLNPPSIRMLAILPAALLLALQTQAQVGTGWTVYKPSERFEYESNDVFFTISPPPSSFNNGYCSFTRSGNVDTCKLLSSHSNRAEVRPNDDYSTGSHQFQAQVFFSAPSTGECIHQIFNGPTGPYLLLRESTNHNGDLTVGGTLPSGDKGGIVASNLLGTWFQLNSINDMNSGTTYLYINGNLVWQGANPGGTFYTKYGAYGTHDDAHPADITFSNVVLYTGGTTNGAGGGDFSLSASPSSVTIVQGANGTSTITETDLNGFTGSVTLSASGLPAGVTASFSPNPTTSTSTLTLTASSSAATGTATVTVTGTSGSLTHTTTISLTVNPPPDFSLSASPGSVTVNQGSSGNSTVSVTDLNGFSGSVSLSASGLPSGVTASFNPSSTTSSSTLTLSASSTAATGTATVTITGTSGSLSHSTTVNLTVNPPPDFSLSTSPSSVTVTQGSSGNSTVSVTDLNGFTGSVSLSASGLPSGVTASFNPSSTTTSSTLTLTASSTAATGTSTVTITGTSGSLSHSTTVTLVVNASGLTWTTINDTDPSITYSAGWSYSTNRNDGDYNNDVHYTKTNGNSAQFSFTGTGVEYITETYSDESNVDIYIDGTYQTTVNCNSATRQAQVVAYSNTGLSSGSHTIKVVKNGGTYMLVDAFAYTTAAVPDFSLSSSPGSVTVTQGSGGNSTISVTDLNGFTGSVSLSASGLPAGVTASFNPSSTTTSSTLTLSASSTAATGTATVTITGTSGSLSHTTTVSLTVNPSPDFSLSASPSSVTVTQGSSGNSTVSVTDLNGFSGSVSLSASGLPSGVTASFNPSSTTTSSTLTLSASSAAATGTATVTITGTSGSLSHTTTLSLTVNASGGGLPTGWTDVDIGAVGLAGSASYNAGTFTIQGSGSDIWTAADQFNYAYQSVSGDQTIVARVVSETGTASYAKAGVMIRESLVTNAVEASVLLTPTNGVAMEVRSTTGAATINVVGWVKGMAAPQWVELVRSGNTFTASYSADGSTWTQFASTNVTMASSATAGLAVTSHDNTSLNTATFDNVSITAGNVIDTTKVYQVQNEASSLVLNNQGSLTNGSAITQWSSNSTSVNLQWTFIATSNGYYQINSVKSGLDAVVQGASTAAGAGIVQWSFGSSGNDQWKPVLNGDGSYTFYNLNSGMVLEDPGSSTSTSTQMDQWTANGGANQNWILVPQ